MRENVLAFLKNKNPKLCVFATASPAGKPDAAVMGYAVKDDLSIIVSTHKGTRKCQNLSQNKQVALVTGWSFTEPYLQCQGEARLIEQGQEYQLFEEFFFTQNKEAAKFKTPDTIFIEIKPTWMRFTDFSAHPSKSEEITL